MDDSLSELLLPLVRERFPDATISRVDARVTEDSDGDPVLWITIVSETEIAELESYKMAGLARHMRPKLRERVGELFPMFRFVSKRDDDRLAHAAA